MAIPIRLILGNNFAEMDLNATNITMNVDRKTTQYPTPNLAAGRVGVDVNTPEIKIDISGILTDDEHATPEVGGTGTSTTTAPLYTVINFENILAQSEGDVHRLAQGAYYDPEVTITDMTDGACNADGTTTAGEERDVDVEPLNFGGAMDGEFTVLRDVPESSSITIVTKKQNFKYGDYAYNRQEFPDDHTRGWVSTGNIVNKAGGYSTSSSKVIQVESYNEGGTASVERYSNDAAFQPESAFTKGDRIVNDSGQLVGIVASANNSVNDTGGVITAAENIVTLELNNAVALADGEELFKQVSLFDSIGRAIGFISSFAYDDDTDEWTITLTSSNSYAILSGDIVYVNKVATFEDRLHGAAFKVTPTYWLEDISRCPSGIKITEPEFMARSGETVQGVYFRFDKTISYVNDATRGHATNNQGRQISSVIGNPGASGYRRREVVINVPCGGIVNSFTNTLTVTGASYNNDPTIQHAFNNEIVVGMAVSGVGIPAGATVASITSTTEFELSVSTTGGSKTGQSLSFTGIGVQEPVNILIENILDAYNEFKNTDLISNKEKEFSPPAHGTPAVSYNQRLSDLCDIFSAANLIEDCTYSSASTTVTHTATTLDLKVGDVITGHNIAHGTTIRSITDSTHFVLNRAPLGSNLNTARFRKLSVNGGRQYIVIRHKYTPKSAITLPNPLSTSLVRLGAEYLQTTNFKGSGGLYSAGDKVQNLIGLVSNASKDVDLIRGIQIPYDSLITSPNITGTTRNFFLTFGQVDATAKTSVGNARSASLPMDVGGLSNVGGQEPPDEKTWIDKIIDSFPGTSGTILKWLKETAETIWITLTSDPHSNINGIRVIPNKLHVRYDAGNKYYAFNLELLASDFVIGA